MIPGRVFYKNGQEWLYFSGTSYLGIPHSAAFKDALMEGFQKYGTNFGGSRLSNLNLAIFEEAEAFLANWCQAPEALSFSSGTLAGQLLLKALEGKPYYAPGTHPALWSAKTAPHSSSFKDWTRQMTELSFEAEGPLLLFANALDPLKLEHYDFEWLHDLAPDRQVTLVVDDSHGIGITGGEGGGFYSLVQPPEQIRLIVVASLGKALGLPGGLVLANKEIVKGIRSMPFFGGASPINPAYLHAFLQSQDYYQAARKALRRNYDLFLRQLKQKERFSYRKHYPVFYTSRNDLAAFLSNYQILISSFPYPSPSDPALTRIVLNSIHTPEDIARLTEVLSLWA